MTQSDSDLCASKLSEALANLAARDLGPKIQTYWRRQNRTHARAVEAATGPAAYSLTVRGDDLNMAVQADFLDALAGLPGVESHAFLSQSGNEMILQVSYAGTTPLHLALYQRLRSNPAFAAMETRTGRQQVILCLSGC